MQELRDDQVRDLVVDRRAEKHDAFGEQPRVDVEGALAARGLLDHHRDQRAHAPSLPGITGLGVPGLRVVGFGAAGRDSREAGGTASIARPTTTRVLDTTTEASSSARRSFDVWASALDAILGHGLAGEPRRPSGTCFDPRKSPRSVCLSALAAGEAADPGSRRGRARGRLQPGGGGIAARPGEQAGARGASGGPGDREQTRAGGKGARRDACDRRAPEHGLGALRRSAGRAEHAAREAAKRPARTRERAPQVPQRRGAGREAARLPVHVEPVLLARRDPGRNERRRSAHARS